ncbi:septation protein SpoVG family protein [bacterium]|nr:septation protein SpoVG family protein [bacterium]
MEVSEVRIKKIARDVDPNAREQLLAWASVTFDGAFVVHNLRIVETLKGLAVFMPSRKMKDGEMKDVAHPLNIETRRKIEQAVLAEYKKQSAVNPSA